MNRHKYSWPSGKTILLVDDDPFLAYSRKSMLERRFSEVERAPDAAQAFIRLEEPGFAGRVGLVIVALGQPGLAGPQFVEELSARAPQVPILAIGRTGETAPDYKGDRVRFLPRQSSSQDVLAGACDILAVPQAA